MQKWTDTIRPVDMDIRDVCCPFAVGSVCINLPVQRILVFAALMSHLPPFLLPNFRQQIVLLSNP